MNEKDGIKVKELIEALKGCNQEAHVSIQIEQGNKIYPVAYRPVVKSAAWETFLNRSWENAGSKPEHGVVRIICRLPEGMYTVQREVKNG